MFAQDGAYSEYVDRFFADNFHPNISWINDIGKHRYGTAANTLFGESKRTADLETRHVRLRSVVDDAALRRDPFSS